jgi:hypothetical protein
VPADVRQSVREALEKGTDDTWSTHLWDGPGRAACLAPATRAAAAQHYKVIGETPGSSI